MPVNGNVIVAPVNIDDVRRVLGDSSRDVGTLCTSKKVNKYSKKKPIRRGNPIVIDDTVFKSANYGITDIPYWTRLASMKSGFVDGKPLPSNMSETPYEYWRYLQPNGSYCKRIHDFQNYSHAAQSPIAMIEPSEIVYKSNKEATVIFGMGAIDNYTLQLQDLGISVGGGDVTHWFSTMYLGLCIYSQSKTYFITQTTLTTQLPSLGNVIRIADADTIAGTYTAFAFLSSRMIQTLQEQDSVTGVYAPIPGTMSQITIKPYKYNFVLDVEYAYRKDIRTVEYRYTIINNEDSAYTTGNINVELVNSLNTVLVTKSYVAVTVQGHSTYSEKLTIVTTTANVAKAAILRISTSIAKQTITDYANVTNELPKA